MKISFFEDISIVDIDEIIFGYGIVEARSKGKTVGVYEIKDIEKIES